MFATDEVASQIVGYNTLNTGDSQVMLGMSFEGIGDSTGVALKELKGDFEDFDNIQVARVEFNEEEDSNELCFTDYFYLASGDDGGSAPEETGAGWYLDDMTTPAFDETIPLGSAVWFISSSGSPKGITVAGQVRGSAYTHPDFDESMEMVCSAFPVSFNPNAADWQGLEDFDNIQVARVEWNEEEGSNDLCFTDYFYLASSEDGGSAPEETGAGWYLDDMTSLVDSGIADPGQGFWLITASPANVKLVEQSPIAK